MTNLDSAMMMDAFKFLIGYGFHVERHDSWRGSYAVFRRGRIALVVDFDTIALSSWLDLYDDNGENVAKIGLTEALDGRLAGLDEIASAVKAHLMAPLCSERAFWELHDSVYGTK